MKQITLANNLKFLSLLIFISMMIACKSGDSSDHAAYLDPSQPVEKRVEDLMSRMTLEEKVAQMCQYVGLQHMRDAAVELSPEEMKKSHMMGFYADFPPEKIEEMTKQGLIGSFLHVTTAGEANYLQSLALQTRLKIPVIIGIDAIHGNGLVSGMTVYPSCIGQAASFNPSIVEKLSRETALEMRATGSHWTFTPNVEVARDPRWGRVGETFGEDPYLVSLMGKATVLGFQTNDITGPDKVLACAKHLVAGSQPINGINGAPADLSERTVREVFFPPFMAALDAGVYTVMAAHNELNGIPCHGNKFLLMDVLRGEWNFDGFVVSDWMDIERMQDYHTISETMNGVFEITVNAGMDMHMHGPDFYFGVLDLVKQGKLSEKRIDESIKKILEAKFKLGLFENPYVDEEKAQKVVFDSKHQETALDAARQSIVLLKNEGILPIDAQKYKNVLVTGPNAANQSILGDWAYPQPDENVVTIYDGLKQVSPETNFSLYEFGWNLRTMTPEQVKEAARQAAKNDLAIVVVGENSMRQHWAEKTSGENSDRYDLSLAGLQQELVEEIHKTGTPVVVVLVNGRPLTTEWISENIPAIVEAWEPGCFGGQAVGEILYGVINPVGKLPITIPRHSGQIQSYYNHKFTSKWFNYATGDSTPLYEFGYGLSYTSYKYGEVKLSADEIGKDGNLTASVDITNTGDREGVEIVQLYIRDNYSSATRPLKELKDFDRIALKPGEIKTVEFTITPDKLAYYDANMNYGVEAGTFTVMIGSSSRDNDLKTAQFTVK